MVASMRRTCWSCQTTARRRSSGHELGILHGFAAAVSHAWSVSDRCLDRATGPIYGAGSGVFNWPNLSLLPTDGGRRYVTSVVWRLFAFTCG